MDESMRAAYCRLNHGDPYQSEDVRTAHQGMGDLIARTWRKEREMARDERRLMARYRKALAADEAATLAAYRQCPKCSGSPNGEPS